MNNDKGEIAMKKDCDANAVDRSQDEIVGQDFAEGVETLAKQFKYVISGLIAIGGNMRWFTQVNEKDASFTRIVESFRTLGPQVASDFYDRKEYDKYFDDMEANAKQDRNRLIRSAFILGFICSYEGFNSECLFEPPKTLHEDMYTGRRELSKEIEIWGNERKLKHLIDEAVAYLSNPGGQAPAASAGSLRPLVGGPND